MLTKSFVLALIAVLLCLAPPARSQTPPRAEPELKDAKAYIARGEAYSGQGLHGLALTDYTKALEIDPSLIEAYVKRAQIYFKLNQYDKAMADYKKALDINPRYVLAYRSRAGAYIMTKRFDQAIADCTMALAIDPKDAVAYDLRARAYYMKGEHAKAREDAHQAVKLGFMVQGDFLELLFQKPAGAIPDEVNDLLRIYKIQQEFSKAMSEGTELQRAGKYEEALEKFQRALALTRRKGTRSEEAWVLRQISDAQQSSKQYDQALQSLNQALQIYRSLNMRSSEVEVLDKIGDVYRSMGDYEKALGHYRQALAIYPGDKVFVEHLARKAEFAEGDLAYKEGIELHRAGRYKEALQSLDQALQIYRPLIAAKSATEGWEGAILDKIGDVYRSMGDYEKAQAHYSQALTTWPSEDTKEKIAQIKEGVWRERIRKDDENWPLWLKISYYLNTLWVGAIGALLLIPLLLLALVLPYRERRRTARWLAQAVGVSSDQISLGDRPPLLSRYRYLNYLTCDVTSVHEGVPFSCHYRIVWGLSSAPWPTSTLEVQISAKEPGSFTVTCEEPIKRLAKRVDLSRELQTGDPSFDQAFYVDTDDEAFAFGVLSSGEKREAVRELFRLGASAIEYDARDLRACWSDFRAAHHTDPGCIRAAVLRLAVLGKDVPETPPDRAEALHAGGQEPVIDRIMGPDRDTTGVESAELAELARKVDRLTGPPDRDTGYKRGISLLAWVGGLAIVVTILVFALEEYSGREISKEGMDFWFWAFDQTLDKKSLAVGSLQYSLPVFLLFAIVRFRWLRGRSWAHRLFVPEFIAFLVGLPLLGFILSVPLNVWLDRAPAKEHLVPVISKCCSHGLGGDIELPSWRRQGATEKLLIPQALHNQVTSGKTWMTIRTKPGYLGYEWVVDQKIAPVKVTKES